VVLTNSNPASTTALAMSDFDNRLSGHLKTGQWWSCQNRPTEMARDSVVLPLCLLIRQVHFGAPTARAAFENVTVMEEAVEHCGDGGAVTEELSPVLHRTVGSQQCAGPPIAPHDDLEEFLGVG